MLMDKPFRTIEEQLEILSSRGVAVGPGAESALKREGYYSIVNGYKDLYINREKSTQEGHDVFDAGTTFDDIYRLFSFDRALRQTLFQYFAKAEAALKTQCAYNFSEAYQGESEPYMNAENYSSTEDQQHVKWLITDFEIALGRHPKKKPKLKAYLDHYRTNHDEVPLWVLLRYMTLGQTFKFYCYQPESMQNRIAKGFSELFADSHSEKIRVTPKRLRIAYDHIKDFRNICAHEERLYCARVSPGKDVSVANVLPDLRLVLPREDGVQAATDIINLLLGIGNEMKEDYFLQLLGLMGFGNIQEVMDAK